MTSRTEARATRLLDALGLGAPACRHGTPEGADCPDCAREAAEDRAKWTDHDAYRADERGVVIMHDPADYLPPGGVEPVGWPRPAAPRPPAPEYDEESRWRDLDEAREAREHAARLTGDYDGDGGDR